MKLWTLNDVLIWLSDNNLEKYKESFKSIYELKYFLFYKNYSYIDININLVITFKYLLTLLINKL